MNLDPYLIPKIKWKWIEYLNTRPDIVKLIEENKGQITHDIGLGDDFPDMTSKAHGTSKNKQSRLHHT